MITASVAEGARAAGMPDERVHASNDWEETLARALGVLAGGDRVLVKGSRAMRMERLVERIATEAAAGSRS